MTAAFPRLIAPCLDATDGPALAAFWKEFLGLGYRPGQGPADDPSFIVVDLRVYDADLDDPNWMTEVARLVARGDDSEGRLEIPADDLEQLPTATNSVDFNYDLIGLHGELTVVRHQLRKVPVDDGDLVIDFLHAVNTPATLY